MASNNGRGPVNRDRFTDTIANGDSTQAILRAQDAAIGALNVITPYINNVVANTLLAINSDLLTATDVLPVAHAISFQALVDGGIITAEGLRFVNAEASGSTVIEIAPADTSSFEVGDRVIILSDNNQIANVREVASVQTNVSVTLTAGLSAAFGAESRIYSVERAFSVIVPTLTEVDLQN